MSFTCACLYVFLIGFCDKLPNPSCCGLLDSRWVLQRGYKHVAAMLQAYRGMIKNKWVNTITLKWQSRVCGLLDETVTAAMDFFRYIYKMLGYHIERVRGCWSWSLWHNSWTYWDRFHFSGNWEGYQNAREWCAQDLEVQRHKGTLYMMWPFRLLTGYPLWSRLCFMKFDLRYNRWSISDLSICMVSVVIDTNICTEVDGRSGMWWKYRTTGMWQCLLIIYKQDPP